MKQYEDFKQIMAQIMKESDGHLPAEGVVAAALLVVAKEIAQLADEYRERNPI